MHQPLADFMEYGLLQAKNTEQNITFYNFGTHSQPKGLQIC